MYIVFYLLFKQAYTRQHISLNLRGCEHVLKVCTLICHDYITDMYALVLVKSTGKSDINLPVMS